MRRFIRRKRRAGTASSLAASFSTAELSRPKTSTSELKTRTKS